MRSRTFVGRVFGAALFLVFPTLALAQVSQTFVSALRGNDTNSCTVASPCRTFTRAITQVAAGGQIVALDSGDYPSFTVGKAVTVAAADGVYAGVSSVSPAIPAIGVNAGASDVVTLRGLTVLGSATYGINFISGKALHLERCFVRGFIQGVYAIGSGDLFMTDSGVSGSSGFGTIFNPTLDTAKLTVERCRATGNGGGGLIAVRGIATVRDSVFSENEVGFGVSNLSVGTSEMNAENCVSSNNNYGVLVTNSHTTLRISNSTVTDNYDIGVEQQNGSVAYSRGNNTIEGNGRDINGILGTYQPK